jgi:hypothetical protein
MELSSAKPVTVSVVPEIEALPLAAKQNSPLISVSATFCLTLTVYVPSPPLPLTRAKIHVEGETPAPVILIPTSNMELSAAKPVTVSVVPEIEALPSATVFGRSKIETSLWLSDLFAQRSALKKPANVLNGCDGV